MKSRQLLNVFLALLCVFVLSIADVGAQSPSALYTWDNTGNAEPNVESWVKNFGTNTVTLNNLTPGELQIIETGTPGEDIAMSDGPNRVRESSLFASGGTDVLGLDFMEFDIGHNGPNPINVQFYVQASTAYSYVALGPDLAVTPGVNTYQVPLTALTTDQAVYLRTIGFSARDHLADGNVTWTLREVRAGGTPLSNRVLTSFNNGTAEGGLNGALVNFDNASVFGNNLSQNNTGLSQNPTGSGSLQWIDLAGGAGGAISVGNGTALNGNTFNNRPADLSNYFQMHVRISATETSTAAGGTIDVQPFFQVDNFAQFHPLTTQALTIDGQFHDLYFTIPALSNMNVVDQTGLNLGSHANELQINVDIIEFSTVPEPASMTMVGMALAGCLGFVRRGRRTS